MAEPLTSIQPLRPILSQQPFGLITDIDGTISPIADTPEAAYVTPACRQRLAQLGGRIALVAVVSGRTVADARRLLGLDNIVYVGNHGLTFWAEGREEAAPGVAPYLAKAQAVVRGMAHLRTIGVHFEEKGPSVALHYRLAEDAVAAREAILAAIQASTAAGAFRVQEGKRVIELRPPLPVDKGTAMRQLAERYHLRGVLYLGDDATDRDAFQAVRELEGQDISGASVAVEGAETPPALLEAADYSLPGIGGVEWLLGELLTAIESNTAA